MQNSYDKDIVSESSKQLNHTLIRNRKMVENSLRMRAMAYLAHAKANLLTQTIFEVENSRKMISKELFYKDELMLSQSRHAQMGEMISMIAHQWRQPLSMIAMGANNILADIELDILDQETLKTNAKDIIRQTQELSKTIEDFRNFFKPDKIAKEALPQDIFNEAFGIIGKSLESNNIEVISRFENNKKIKTYSRELMQVIINILKNAKDALIENRKDDRKIFITLQEYENKLIISICDNAGGIKDKIKDKIFNPYFSTKDNKSGTGLGLYISKTIIEKHLNGTLNTYNKNDGACFEIALPFTIDDRGKDDE